MKDVIYDCPHYGLCGTVTYAGKCSKACIERRNKEMGIKPTTNADRILAMTDREIAEFLAKKFADLQAEQLSQPTATQLHEIALTWFCAWMQWLRQPVGED